MASEHRLPGALLLIIAALLLHHEPLVYRNELIPGNHNEVAYDFYVPLGRLDYFRLYRLHLPNGPTPFGGVLAALGYFGVNFRRDFGLYRGYLFVRHCLSFFDGWTYVLTRLLDYREPFIQTVSLLNNETVFPSRVKPRRF
jgi:hypothetical protein